MSQNSAVIDDFVAAWKSMDLDKIMSFFTPDAVYINMPIEPASEGLEAIRKTIEGFIGMADQIEFVVKHTSENASGVVMNERVDRFHLKDGGKWVEAQVMGVFELEGGKIKAWRDYFDLAGFTGQMGG